MLVCLGSLPLRALGGAETEDFLLSTSKVGDPKFGWETERLLPDADTLVEDDKVPIVLLLAQRSKDHQVFHCSWDRLTWSASTAETEPKWADNQII